MKSASDVIANVQSIRLLGVPPFISIPPLSSECLLTSVAKKETSGLSVRRTTSSVCGPRLVGVEQVHRGDHVDQHPLGEERATACRRRRRRPARRSRRARRSPCGRPRRRRDRRRRRRSASARAGGSGSSGSARRRPGPSPSAPPRRVLPSAACSNVSRVSAKQRSTEAMKSSFFVRKRRKRYGCEMPARRAISSVDAPESPCSANTSRAASRTSSRRSSAVFRVVVARFTGSKLSLTHKGVKTTH